MKADLQTPSPTSMPTHSPSRDSVAPSLGAYLREQRARHGLSQYDLAQAVGVSQQTVSVWERDRASPSPEHVAAVSEALGVSLYEWVGERDLSKPVSLQTYIRAVGADDPNLKPAVGKLRLTKDQQAFRSALAARIQTGEPLGADEIRFLRDVAKRLYEIEL